MLISHWRAIGGWLHGGQHFVHFCKQSTCTRILWSVWEQSFNNLFLLFNPNYLWMLKCKGGWSKALKQYSQYLSLKAMLLKKTGDTCCRSNLIPGSHWVYMVMVIDAAGRCATQRAIASRHCRHFTTAFFSKAIVWRVRKQKASLTWSRSSIVRVWDIFCSLYSRLFLAKFHDDSSGSWQWH